MLLGSALVSWVRPHPGETEAFHRWYERDHFYAGVRAGPGCFAGRRYVQPPAARDGEPVFLHVYWIEAGAHAAFADWAFARARDLRRAGRMFDAADQLATGFYAPAEVSGPGAADALLDRALDHAFPGVAAAVLDDPAPPSPLSAEGARLAAGFRALPLPEAMRRHVPPGAERALVLRWLDAAPDAAATADASGVDGPAALASAFVPTLPGGPLP